MAATSLPKPFSQTLTISSNLSGLRNTFLPPRSLNSSSRRSLSSSNRSFVVRASSITIHNTTPSTTTKTTFKQPSNLSFPSKSHNFPSSFTPHKPPLIFPTFSSKTTTIHPLKPPKTPPSFPSSPTKHSPSTPTSTPQEFHKKALFLHSYGLDPLSHLPPSSIANSPSLSDLKTSFDYLLSIGLTSSQLRRIIIMCPDILSLTLRDTAQVLAFLLREVKVRADDLPRVISRRPRLLVSDVETRLRPTLYFLQSIGIHEVHKHTNLLSASVEDKFVPKIDFFEKVGFQHHDAVSLFRKFPPLFCYSVKENFEPKFNYFVVKMGRDLKELKRFPQYFSFSLENRIKLRHQCCVESGVYLTLPVMLKTKEDVFRKRLDVCCNSSMPKSDSPLWV